MALLGGAALAMWWDMAPGMRDEFQHWHTHEHFPERLAIPGFLRASRWASVEGDGFFVMYELAEHAVLSSPEYLARLNAPTPWSRKLMPHHANMVRSQCEVLESAGAVASRYALTARFSPASGADKVRADLSAWMRELVAAPGLAGAHLLRTRAPGIAPTAEQRIRGNADREADWIFVACGYAREALDAIEHGALGLAEKGIYQLSLCAVARDVQ
jgi:hypothetical protein